MTIERIKKLGITSVEELACCSVDELLKLGDIDAAEAKKYILIAQKHLESMKTKNKINSLVHERFKANPKNIASKEQECEASNLKKTIKISIDAMKQLATSKAEDLSREKGIEISNAKKYIDMAKKYLEEMRVEKSEETKTQRNVSTKKISSKDILLDLKILNEKPTPKVQNLPKKPQLSDLVLFKETVTPPKVKLELPPLKIENIFPKKPLIKPVASKVASEGITEKLPSKKKPDKSVDEKTFFPLEKMQKIRFLHFKIKDLEKALQRNDDFSVSEINNIIDYVQLLNINYKTQSQIRIFKELDITPSFYDPIEKKEIKIWDLIFECSRVLWVAALAYSYLSKKYESLNLMENAIVAMVECSKMYKTSAYFSAACTRQEENGTTLSVDKLELNSEEARIFAQNLATISEERKENYSMAANLSAGLSALTKRLVFAKKYAEVKEYQLKAQYNYDIGKACHFKAKSLMKKATTLEENEIIERFKQKANYYYFKAEEIWEYMLNNIEDLTVKEKDNLKINLSVVNQDIMENDVPSIDEQTVAEIEDPEPLIIIPENLAPFVPRTTNYLEQYRQSDLNFDAYLRYKNLMSEVFVNFNKLDELKNNKAGIGRTIKQLKVLYENNDIDINTFTELLEKYNIKLETLQTAINNLTNPKNQVKPIDKKLKQYKAH